ncbi:MAG: TerB family tellurite resistance protein [Nannocystaceae bacterium]
MPLSPEQEWTLVACGLLALADQVLTGGEASRLLTLVDAYLGPDEQDHWMDLVSDRAALEAHFATMEPPTGDNHLGLLEHVWHVALADGEASLTEIRVFEHVGERLGIPRDQLAVFRKKWTYEAMDDAEIIAGLFNVLYTRTDPRGDDDLARYTTLLGRLPLSQSRRERLRDAAGSPPTVEHLGELYARLTERRQREVIRSIATRLIDNPKREAIRAIIDEVVQAAGGAAAGSVVEHFGTAK